MNDKFNPYPEGTIKPIPEKEYPNLNPEHRQYLELLNQKKQLETKLREVNDAIDRREEVLLKIIDSGKRIPWCWKWILKKTNISWKGELEKVIGKKKVQEISAKTPATKYPHIGVEGFHPKPKMETKRLPLKRKEE